MKNTTTLNILNLIGFILMVTVNVLANALPIAGRTTGDVSDYVGNLFVPAGFTFSIWGVIYAALAFFIFYNFKNVKKWPVSDALKEIGFLFLISCIINAVWIVCWHNLFIGTSLILMLGLLTTLILIYLKTRSLDTPLAMNIPFSIYLGWISVATIANTAGFLTFINWDGFGVEPQTWTIIMLSVATILGLIMLFRFKDYAFVGVVLWALWGILYKRLNDDVANDSMIEWGIHAMFAVLVIGIIIRIYKKR